MWLFLQYWGKNKEMGRTSAARDGMNQMNISCFACANFHYWTGKVVFFFSFHYSQIICSVRFNMFGSPLKIFMRMQNRIASFFIRIILYLFCPAGGAHQQARLIWLPSALFRGVACPRPSLLSLQSIAAPQIVSPGAPWVVGDEEEGGSDMCAALNCYRFSYLNPPTAPPFFKS